jgi:hypothetical protein
MYNAKLWFNATTRLGYIAVMTIGMLIVGMLPIKKGGK